MAGKRKRYGSSRGAKRPRSGYRRRRFTNRLASRRNISKIARQVVLSTAESKNKTGNHGKTEVYHNSLATLAHLNLPSATFMPQQGDGDDGRAGDSIIMRGFKVRCLFGQKANRPNLTWRVLIVAQRLGTGFLTYNMLFENKIGNGLLDQVNKDRVTVLMQKYMKPAIPMSSHTVMPGAEEYGQEYTFSRRFWIPRKKIYKFETDGGSQHNDRDIVMYCIPYDAFGTLVTDNVGYVQTWVDVCYKDP